MNCVCDILKRNAVSFLRWRMAYESSWYNEEIKNSWSDDEDRDKQRRAENV